MGNQDKKSDLLKRRGTFTVTRDAIEMGPEEVAEALSSVLVVQLENIFMTNSIKYGGYSRYFDLLEADEDTPNYIAECKKSESGTITVTWHREKEYTERDVRAILDDINKRMSLKVEDIVKSAVMVNKDTLVLKVNCFLHPDATKKISDELRSQCTGIEVIILPGEVDIVDVAE